jgi:hypothetical protein
MYHKLCGPGINGRVCMDLQAKCHARDSTDYDIMPECKTQTNMYDMKVPLCYLYSELSTTLVTLKEYDVWSAEDRQDDDFDTPSYVLWSVEEKVVLPPQTTTKPVTSPAVKIGGEQGSGAGTTSSNASVAIGLMVSIVAFAGLGLLIMKKRRGEGTCIQ